MRARSPGRYGRGRGEAALWQAAHGGEGVLGRPQRELEPKLEREAGEHRTGCGQPLTSFLFSYGKIPHNVHVSS